MNDLEAKIKQACPNEVDMEYVQKIIDAKAAGAVIPTRHTWRGEPIDGSHRIAAEIVSGTKICDVINYDSVDEIDNGVLREAVENYIEREDDNAWRELLEIAQDCF